MCQGYAAPAVFGGRVYLNDYDRKAKQWMVRCHDLKDGKELWRFVEGKKIRPNHGITRSVPAVDGKYVISLDPKCVLHCLDAVTGKELWQKNFVREYKSTIPAWYNGQCPLIEEDRVVVALGGTSLIVALNKTTGDTIWATPNSEQRPLSHASIMVAEIGGVKQYLYTTLQGPLGVAADDGRLLWSFPWKFNIAVANSPLYCGEGRLFYTNCYETETVMIQVTREGDTFKAEKLFSLAANDWNSETHTPIFYQDHIFGVGKKRRGLFTCLNLKGENVWDSKGKAAFGLGSYILADGMFFILEGKTGMLRLVEANTTEYKELASTQILSGHDVWAPLALSDGKLLIRDMTRLVCLDVADPNAAASTKK